MFGWLIFLRLERESRGRKKISGDGITFSSLEVKKKMTIGEEEAIIIVITASFLSQNTPMLVFWRDYNNRLFSFWSYSSHSTRNHHSSQQNKSNFQFLEFGPRISTHMDGTLD